MRTIDCDLDHYLSRSHEWFIFMCEHPEVRTKRILIKLYNAYMLCASHFYLLIQNTDSNAQSILN